jgi:hypothetical protein
MTASVAASTAAPRSIARSNDRGAQAQRRREERLARRGVAELRAHARRFGGVQDAGGAQEIEHVVRRPQRPVGMVERRGRVGEVGAEVVADEGEARAHRARSRAQARQPSGSYDRNCGARIGWPPGRVRSMIAA